MRRHHTILCAVVAGLFLTSCTQLLASPTPLPTETPAAAPTLEPPPTAQPSPTARPSATPEPSATPKPTRTPRPTQTPKPTRAAAAYPGVIVYTQVNPRQIDIYTLAPGGEPERLTDLYGASYQPYWSPDGTQVAFIHYDPDKDQTDIWVVDAAGAEPHAVTESGLQQVPTLSWSPDGRYVVYHDVQSDGSERDVLRAEVETGEVVNLTEDEHGWDSDPDWSPAGDRIVFVSDRVFLDAIWVMGADGSDAVNLTEDAEAWENIKPAWSPDGERIAFYRWSILAEPDTPGGPAGLWVMNAAGSDAHVVAELDNWMGSDPPVWSPDGQYIAFDYGAVDETDIYVVPAAGGEPVQICSLPGNDKGASWSPDSKALIFTHDPGTSMVMYIALPDGSDTHVLLEDIPAGLGDWGK